VYAIGFDDAGLPKATGFSKASAFAF